MRKRCLCLLLRTKYNNNPKFSYSLVTNSRIILLVIDKQAFSCYDFSMTFSACNKLSWETVTGFIEKYVSGMTITQIAAEGPYATATIRKNLRSQGLFPSADKRKRIRAMLLAKVSIERIVKELDVPIEDVQAMNNRLQQHSDKIVVRNQAIINLAYKGYSTKYIARIVGVRIFIVQQVLRDLDLFDKQAASVSAMFDEGIDILSIANKLDRSVNQVKKFLRVTNRIDAPQKPLRGFQNPNNYMYRHDDSKNR